MYTLVLFKHRIEKNPAKKKKKKKKKKKNIYIYIYHTKIPTRTNRKKLHWKRILTVKLLKFSQKTLSEMYWKKINFETENLSKPFDNNSWY